MQSTLYIGRYGPVSIRLNFLWIPAFVIGLWWLALLWLPDNFPSWSGTLYWAVAVVVLLLFLMCVILHEVLHTLIAGTGRRTANLFPFGAAMPFRLRDAASGRLIAGAIAGIALNLLLGLVLTVGGGAISSEGALAVLRGVLIPLGMLNLWFGLVNLVPGVPFDGGWALTGTYGWFGGDTESGLSTARSIGAVAALAFLLVGVWVALTSDAWLLAISLALLGWATREAANIGRHRVMLRGALQEITAADLMERSASSATIQEGSTVADLVRAFPRYPQLMPVAVHNDAGALVGIVTTGAADQLLQGTWPVTPVRGIMTQISDVRALHPESPLTEALHTAQMQKGSVQEDTHIPVISGDELVGSIDPGRLVIFEQVGQEFGIEEALPRPGAGGPLQAVRSFVPPLALLALLTILGSFALRTNPADVREKLTPDTAAELTFANLTPADGSIVGVGQTLVSADIVSPGPVVTATLSVNGQVVEAALDTSSAEAQTISAVIEGLTQGVHNVRVRAVTDDGRSKSEEWQFRIVVER